MSAIYSGMGPDCEVTDSAVAPQTSSEIMRQIDVYGNITPLAKAVKAGDLAVLADVNIRKFLAAKLSNEKNGKPGPKKCRRKQLRNTKALYLLGFYESLGYPIWDATQQQHCCSIVARCLHLSDSQIHQAVWLAFQRQIKLSADDLKPLEYNGDLFDETDYLQGNIDGVILKDAYGGATLNLREVPELSKMYDAWEAEQIRLSPWWEWEEEPSSLHPWRDE